MIYWKKNTIRKKIKYVDYAVFDAKIINQFNILKKSLHGIQVVHLNATAKGGGVAELLNSQIAFERSLGINSSWYSIEADNDFFIITKKIHNLLQGKEGCLSRGEKNYYLQVNERLSEELNDLLAKNPQAIVVIHDPQPLAMIKNIQENGKCILRLHIDLSYSNRNIISFLRPYVSKYKYVVISNIKFRKTLQISKTALKIIPPAIDPLANKNLPITDNRAWSILQKFGLDSDKQLITQVSRFDAFKNPIGVVKAFKKIKLKKNNLQLVLAGFAFAKDDPEAFEMYKQTKKIAGDDKDIHLFIDPIVLKKNQITNDEFIRALYTVSTVIVQNSLQEGFGLTITEAMWKEKAVIAGNAEGPRMQITNNKNGIIIDSNKQLTKCLMHLLDNESLRLKLGKTARKSVGKNFLLPKYIFNHLNLYLKVIKGNSTNK
jgi:trehalose synthase